jgi:hypothetical protein
MKVIVAGSRDGFVAKNVFEAIEESPFVSDITEIVSGTARGVDRDGEYYATCNNIAVKHFPADWDAHGKAAGHIRNRQMAEYADALVAVWDGKSRGTKNMIDTMKKLGKPVYVYTR